MDLIAVMATKDPKILQNSDEALQARAKIFEEYANGGFEILESQLAGVNDISQQILLLVKTSANFFEIEDLDVLSFL